MKLWAVKVESGEPLHVKVAKGKILHVSMAVLGETITPSQNEYVTLYMSIDGMKHVLATLNSQILRQQLFDFFVEKDFQISHNSNSGIIHFNGYTTDAEEVEYENIGVQRAQTETKPGVVEEDMPQEQFGEKRATTGHTVNISNKKARASTPQESDKKWAGDAHTCKSCNRSFNSDAALQSHNQAKHK